MIAVGLLKAKVWRKSLSWGVVRRQPGRQNLAGPRAGFADDQKLVKQGWQCRWRLGLGGHADKGRTAQRGGGKVLPRIITLDQGRI